MGLLKPTIIGNILGFNKMNKQKGITDMGVKFDGLVYGDYNPDQWLEYPNILEEDIRLMKKAHINTVSLGIFGVKLKQQEGVYDFDWMEEIINRLYENGISVFARPSGARTRTGLQTVIRKCYV